MDFSEKRKCTEEPGENSRRKRPRPPSPSSAADLFCRLPDDLIISILCKFIISSSACCPSDLASIMMTCKRLNRLVLNPLVLSKAPLKSLAVKAQNWSDDAHRFLRRCADAGNLEACYILGMIKFYCLGDHRSGTSLLARAAIGSHAAALYSIAIIQFNGSGGCRSDKNPRAGVALLARSAFLGLVDALRELGHCLQDGYGVRQSIAKGRAFLLEANAKEIAAAGSSSEESLFSDFGRNVAALEVHPANRFLVEWFRWRPFGSSELRLCSYGGCGRAETRKHEFRRCSVCGKVNYCSRACQSLHWKLVHRAECVPGGPHMQEDDGEADDGEAMGATEGG